MAVKLRKKLEQWLEKGDLEDAKIIAEQLEKETNRLSGEKSDERLLHLYVLAKCYRIMKNYDKVAKYSQEAIRLAKHGKHDMDTIIAIYLNDAAFKREYGQFSNARIQLAHLLALLDKKQYPSDYSYGLVYRDLGKIALDEGNVDAGLSQLQKALSYFQKSVSVEHPIIAKTIHALSKVYIQMERYPHALEYELELLKIYETRQDPVQVGQQLLVIGEVYFYIDLKKARQTIMKALQLLVQNDHEHPDIAKANLMLAEMDENMHYFPRAITYYKRALEQVKMNSEQREFLLVYMYAKIGTISLKINELGQAKVYLEKGLTLSEPFPKIKMQFLFALGKLYSKEKQYGKAEQVYQEFMVRLEQTGKKHSLAYGKTLEAIGKNYVEQSKFDTAIVYYEQALETYTSIPNCKEEKIAILVCIAFCYENKQELDQAEGYFEKALQSAERSYHKAWMKKTLAKFIDFYKRTNQWNKLRKYEKRFAKLQE